MDADHHLDGVVAGARRDLAGSRLSAHRQFELLVLAGTEEFVEFAEGSLQRIALLGREPRLDADGLHRDVVAGVVADGDDHGQVVVRPLHHHPGQIEGDVDRHVLAGAAVQGPFVDDAVARRAGGEKAEHHGQRAAHRRSLRQNARMINRRNFARLISLAAAAATVSAAPPPRKIVKPKRLREGDTVGLVLPASATFESDDIQLAKEQLEAIGLKVAIGAHAYDRHGYFAGRDRDRADDLNRMFADDRIAGVVCFTGGWGSPRVLPHLDYELIARKPKVLIGYSDVTALLNAIHQRTGLVTFHGPAGASTIEPYSLDNFRRVVMSPEPAGVLGPPPKKATELVDRTNRVLRLHPGKATGRLTGGNLTLLASLMGTPFEIETEGAIVFAEDVREEVYRIDRMLTQLALGGKLERMAGFVFGRCTDCKATTFSLEDVLRDRFGSGPAPAISGLSFGHIEQKLTLPIGVTATLDADAGTLEVREGAVG